MISYRGLAAHLIVLAVATALALFIWTKEDAPRVAKEAQVQVWAGKPDQLTAIEFESDDRKVRLVSKKDSGGAWFEGTVQKTVRVPPPAPRPVDGGPDGASVPPPPPPPEPKQETVRFVGVKQAGNLAESVAPLMALRALGKLEEARNEEFGFDKPDGTLKVTFGSTTHIAILGGTTPGGGDRYAKLESGEVFAIPGSVAQNLLFAESRLVERDLFDFEPEEIEKVHVTAGDKRRELVRLADKKDGWADAATPRVQDETAGNWMSKVTRLRILNYDENAAKESPSEVVKLEYFGKGNRRLGALEVSKVAGIGGKGRFVAKTPHTRWFAEVLASAGEQIEQDLSSVLR